MTTTTNFRQVKINALMLDKLYEIQFEQWLREPQLLPDLSYRFV